MKRWLHNVYFKIFCVVIPLTVAMMFVPAMLINNHVKRALELEMRAQLASALDMLVPYVNSGELSVDSFAEFLTEPTYQVEVYHGKEQLPLNRREIARVDQEQITMFEYPQQSGMFKTTVRCGEEYVLITVDIRHFLQRTSLRGTTLWVISLLIGICGLVITGQRLVKPIITLDNAAKEVAAGDFSVRVPSRRKKDQVSSLIDSFNEMVRELGDVEIFRSGFISDVSHEFKIPLTTISGYARLLQDVCSPEEQAEYTQVIIEETSHLSTLVDNILMLNRLEKHSAPIKVENVAVAEQIRRTLTLYEPVWAQKGIQLDFSLEEVSYLGHGTLLMQVWTNLIENAVKFTPSGGNITIRLSQEEGGIRFVISDTGCGIEPEKQRHIFDKFYKADNSRNSDGNGLGLAIVRRIVEIQGGSISVDSTPGQGAVFTVFLKNNPLEAHPTQQ